jgi:glucose/mannose-6-phosphate isomerase
VGQVGSSLDSLGMLSAALAWPDQLAAAVERPRTLTAKPVSSIDRVVIAGMGGSAMAGDLVAAVAARTMAVPVSVVRGYQVPAHVGPTTLFFAVSFSGETEETLEAANQAGRSGAIVIAISEGGTLADLAAERGWPHWIIPAGIPQPRAGLAAMAGPMLAGLGELGFIDGMAGQLAGAIDQLATRRQWYQTAGGRQELSELANRLARRVILAIGGGSLGAVAASRLKAQINENCKSQAFSATHPELCHNEIAGWGQNGDLARQAFAIVELRHSFEHPRVAARFDLTRDVWAESVPVAVTLRAARGEGVVAEVCDLIMQADLLSLAMADNLGVDPGPVPILADLKSMLNKVPKG